MEINTKSSINLTRTMDHICNHEFIIINLLLLLFIGLYITLWIILVPRCSKRSFYSFHLLLRINLIYIFKYIMFLNLIKFWLTPMRWSHYYNFHVKVFPSYHSYQLLLLLFFIKMVNIYYKVNGCVSMVRHKKKFMFRIFIWWVKMFVLKRWHQNEDVR